ncbi:MAG: transcriptional regulator, TetR family [Verrucomicrobiaceae bacterium]|nr:transcriptional regulator, TetR family [Verrucomicrobiaceae bacterium]
MSSPARDRLLAAASEVFSREGLQGATTRVIAREAGVSEVTLFRLFENKEKLLAEVLAHVCSALSGTLAAKGDWSNDLRADLTAFARAYSDMLVKNEAMIRTLIGEASRHQDHARQLIKESVKPARVRLIAYLHDAQERGQVRKGLELPVVADMFSGMLLSGMLRRSSHGVREYSAATYLESCVDVLVAGIAAPAEKPKR